MTEAKPVAIIRASRKDLFSAFCHFLQGGGGIATKLTALFYVLYWLWHMGPVIKLGYTFAFGAAKIKIMHLFRPWIKPKPQRYTVFILSQKLNSDWFHVCMDKK